MPSVWLPGSFGTRVSGGRRQIGWPWRSRRACVSLGRVVVVVVVFAVIMLYAEGGQGRGRGQGRERVGRVWRRSWRDRHSTLAGKPSRDCWWRRRRGWQGGRGAEVGGRGGGQASNWMKKKVEATSQAKQGSGQEKVKASGRIVNKGEVRKANGTSHAHG